MSFDITTQAEAAKQEDVGTVVEINGVDELPAFYTDANGVEQPVTITVAGIHSSIYRKIEAKMRRRKIKPRQLSGESIYDDNIEKVVGCTLDWVGFSISGTVLDFTRHNIRELYRQCPWVYEQVLEAMHDHSRFFGNGSTSPESTLPTEPS